MNNKWTFNDEDEGLWCHDHFDTKEEAIKAAIEYSNDDEGQPMYVGKIIETPVPCPIVADRLLEEAYDMLDEDDEYDQDLGDKFYDGITKEQTDALEKIMEAAWTTWVEKYNIKTNSSTIGCVEKVKR
jgi:hypothetical protein